jgi:hypothetical protein
MQQNMSVRFMFPTDVQHGELANMSFTSFTGIPNTGDIVRPTPDAAPLRVTHREWTVEGALTRIEIHLGHLN